MTEPATTVVLMKQEKKSSAIKITLWTKYHPHKMHCFNTLDGHCIKQEFGQPCTQAQPTIPSPEEFGWTMELGHCMPVWITLPEVSKTCSELIKCSCKGNCMRCRCVKAHLNYSPLCTCNCNVNTNFMDSCNVMGVSKNQYLDYLRL